MMRQNSGTAKGRPRGFTLIELLVVVSIIALLMSLLIPTLAQAQNKAKEIACGANLHALGLAMKEYLTENNDIYPFNGILFPKPCNTKDDNYSNLPPAYVAWCSNPQTWKLPNGGIFSAITNPKVFLCPQDVVDGLMRLNPANPGVGTELRMDASGNVIVPVGPGAGGYWSYSVNSVLNSQGQFRNNFQSIINPGLTPKPWIDPLKQTNVQNESDFLVFIEEDDASPFNDEVFDAPAYNGGDKLTDRHNHKGNLGFSDGHVEPMQEVLFNNVPSGVGNQNQVAMQSLYTCWFFPDEGAFAN